MKNFTYTLISNLIAVVFWLADATGHYFAEGRVSWELIPTSTNELIMRSIIITLIIAFGLFADYHARREVKKAKAMEALSVYGSTLYATHHILNNLLHQMQLVRFEAEKSQDFDKETLVIFNNALREAGELVNALSNVENITCESIRASVLPQHREEISSSDTGTK